MFMQTDLIVCREAGFLIECAVFVSDECFPALRSVSSARPEAVADFSARRPQPLQGVRTKHASLAHAKDEHEQ